MSIPCAGLGGGAAAAPPLPHLSLALLPTNHVDPPVQDSVVEPLLPHFLQFYEADEQLTPPLKLEACVRVQARGRVVGWVGGWGGGGVAVLQPIWTLSA